MTNPMLPTHPATYCGASHHATTPSTGNMGHVRANRLPLGATVGGSMWSLTLGTICHPRKRIVASTGNGCVVVKRTSCGVVPMLYVRGGHYREERMS